MALIAGSLPPQTCYGTPQQMLDLFAQYLSSPTQNLVLDGGLTSLPQITIQADGASDSTLTIAGASPGDACFVALQSFSQAPGYIISAVCNSPNTIIVSRHNIKSTQNTFPSIIIRVKVLKFG
jgi:hypothetical protein